MSRWRDDLDDLVARRGQALVGYAFIVCGNSHDAEDLVQEAFVKVFGRLRPPSAPDSTVHPLDGDQVGPTHPEAYVRRAILSLHIDGYRRRARYNDREHLLVDDEPLTGAATGASVRADVAAALAGLTPQQRSCVVLRYFDDLTVPQIAARLGIAEGTIKRHLSDATGRLRALLDTSDTPALPARSTARPQGGLR